MKAPCLAALAALLLLLRPAESAAQAALFWDTQPASSGAQGGSGNWLGTNFWNNVFPGNNVAWVDGVGAAFSGTPGNVTVNGPVTASQLSFNVNGYTINGASTLTLGDSTPDIFVNTVASNTATISAPLGGSAGFNKLGPGTLTLSGAAANTYTGLATVTEGTLNLSKSVGINAITGNLTIGDGTGAAASRIVIQGANNQIPDTATVTIEEDGFWNLASGNRSETIGDLIMFNSSVATGTGTLTLNGNVRANDSFNNPAATISGLLDLGGATRFFHTERFVDLIISAAISNGGLAKMGGNQGDSAIPVRLTLSGTAANTYTGMTTVFDGELVLNKPAGVNAISGDLTIGVGGGEEVVSQGADNQIADTATVAIAARGWWNLASGNRSETIAALTMTSGIIDTGSGTLTINGNVTTNASADMARISGQLNLSGASRVFDVALGSNSSSDLFIAAVISNGGLTKMGSGRLTLSGASTFSGQLAINGGIVSVSTVSNSGVNGNLGAGNSISFDGGTMAVTAAANSTTDRAVTLNAGGGTINVENPGAALTMSGVLTGGGGLTKIGAGTLTLSGATANTYAGATMVADGTLNLSKSASVNAIPGNLTIGDGSGASASAVITQGANEQISDTTSLTIAADGFWNLASGNRSETIAALVLTAGSVAMGSGALTVNGSVTSNANAASASIAGHLNLGGVTRMFDIADGAAANDLEISAAISNGSAGLTKSGTGTLRLSGTNNYNGPVTINAGTLLVGNGSAIGDSSDVTVVNAATLGIEGSETIGSLAGSGVVILGTANTLSVGGGGSTTFSGTISGAGGLTRSGAGMLTFSGAPTHTGNTLVSGGTLVLNSGIASAGGSLTVNAPGTLQARNTVNRAITGDGTITATGTLIIGDPSSAAGFAFDGALNTGSNTVTLADADVAQLGVTATLGNNGRLDTLNGAILGSGRSITAAASATAGISGNLTNNGTVNGPTTPGQSLNLLGDVNGVGNYTGNVRFSAQLSPGLSPAAVSLENFQFDPTTVLRIEIGGTNAGVQFDQLNFTGTGLVDGNLSVSLINGFNPQPGNGFTFLQGGLLSGAFDAMDLPPLDPGYSWSYSQTANSALLTVIPEPQLASLLAIGVFAMAMVRRPARQESQLTDHLCTQAAD